MMVYTAYAAAWIATAVVVLVAIYLTGSAWPLLAFAFPAQLKVQAGGER